MDEVQQQIKEERGFLSGLSDFFERLGEGVLDGGLEVAGAFTEQFVNETVGDLQDDENRATKSDQEIDRGLDDKLEKVVTTQNIVLGAAAVGLLVLLLRK